MIWTIQKEAFIQIPHVAEGLVIESQLPVCAKDGDSIRHMVQRLIMCANMAVQFLAGILLLGDVEGHGPCPTGQRECQHTHRAALAINNHVARFIYICAFGNRLAGLI